ncbi:MULTISPECIES: ABC transporter substrate-binding protein [unclassified Halanaerobium]|uniref:ABC transporter substrate-binding protein n=1 Tax=unclassified Halanaerobium TaxID=2641197 RepID=UPI000DF18177|nr:MULTISPECIES: ABC transporter substrate-binding protein [unclassified Halanaerobium]RCW50680.1 peptide/nickel transport system substrate-binding protein [Halanaerobium sp. MA284_MarDTE_T2]RCW86848.1 peptide/nickel transport system substrate-binding protein [Halanaerobium sp. DL-01]
MKRTLFILILTSILTISLLGSVQAQDKETFVMGIEDEVSNLDPGFTTISVNERVASLIFDGLVEYGEKNKIVPGIAKEWTISEDGTEYTFTISKGVKFHDGSELTADDVKFTYERILDPEAGSGLRAKIESIESIEVLNDYKIKFKLKKPYSPFILAMTFGIVPEDYVKENGEDVLSRNPIGAGPFKLENWEVGNEIELSAFEDHWNKVPKLKTVIIRPIAESSTQAMELRSGGIDFAVNLDVGQLQSFADNENFKVKSAPGAGINFMGFNFDIAPYNNLEFRKAVIQAVPFKEMVPQIFGMLGQNAYSMLPPTLWPDDREYLKENTVKFNPAAARKKFAELKENGVIPKDFTAEIYVSNSRPSQVKTAEAMVTALNQAGLTAEVNAMEFGTMWDMLGRGEIGMFFLRFVSDPDPDYWLYRFFKSDGSLNRAFYEDEEVDQWLEEARVVSDQEKRAELYVNVLRKVLTKDIVFYPFAHSNQIYVMKDNVMELEPGNSLLIPLVTPTANVYKK